MNGIIKGTKGALRRSGQAGFTLLELMIAMAILGVLMSIVAPRVSGTKGTSIESQIKSDAYNIQTGINNYNSKSIKNNAWPDQALGTSYAYSATAGGVTLAPGDKVVLVNKGVAVAPDVSAYVEIAWEASTGVWESDGTVNTAKLAPDFVQKIPETANLRNDEGISDSTGKKLSEVLWLMKKNQVGTSQEGRTIEVYRLTSYDAATRTLVYERLF